MKQKTQEEKNAASEKNQEDIANETTATVAGSDEPVNEMLDQPAQTEFKRKQIGLSDTKKQELVRKTYGELADLANQAAFELTALIDTQAMEPLSVKLVLDFLKSKNPETWLVEKYVAARGMKVQHLKTEKLIESGFFDLPDYSKILAFQTEFSQWKSKINELNFIFPFSKLFIPEDNVFILTEAFESALTEATTKYTQNDQQNEALEALESICKGLNTFNMMGIANVQKNGLTLFSSDFGLLFNIDRTNHEEPVSPNPNVFRNRMLRRFYYGPLFGSQEKVDFWG